MYFLNCNSTQKPGIVDKDLNEILDPDEVYSGCWGRASINFFPFNTNGNKGIGVGLNNIQKLKDDDRLGAARASAESDFGGDDFEDDEDFYQSRFTNSAVVTALTKVADDRHFNPLREYIQALPEWDGVARVDTLLIDYLGAEDTA